MSISRRDFLGLVGGSVAGATVVAAGVRAGGVASSGAASSGTAAGVTEQAPAALAAWVVAEVGQVDRGALPFVLENRSTGERLRVEACRHGQGSAPVARSAEFDLFVANHGDGGARTAREHELVARALAKQLDGVRATAPAGVTSLDARHAQHRSLFTTADDVSNA